MPAKNFFGETFDFFQRYWSHMTTGFLVLKGFFDNEDHKDDPNPVVKLIHGGRFSIMDELLYEALERSLPPEMRRLLFGFRQWARAQFGQTLLGRFFHSKFDNDFRGMILRKREPSRVEVTTETTRGANGKDVVRKIEKVIPADDEPAKDLMVVFVKEILDGYNQHDGSEEEKLTAGYQSLLRYLEGYGMPSISRLATIANRLNEMLDGIPPAAGRAARLGSIMGRRRAVQGARLVRDGAIHVDQLVDERAAKINARSRWHWMNFFGG